MKTAEMTEELCDLHVHSTFSDGTDTPARLLEIAEEAGLKAIALCDHNTVEGLPEFLQAAQGREVEAVPGIEFSTEYLGTELHILALFIQPEHYDRIRDLLWEMLRAKDNSNIALVQALNQAGMNLDYEAIRQKAGGVVNRAVIGAEMVRQGYCASVKEAFSRWLSQKRGYYQPPKRLDAFETIGFIRSIGAVSVLAHPFLNLEEASLREFLKTAKDWGLDAMEVYYPLFTPEEIAAASQIAEEFSLKKTGGSDYHGKNKPHIQMGKGLGQMRISAVLLDGLRKEKNR